MMTVLGVDVSSNDAGLSLASTRRAGFRFVTARILAYPKGVITLDSSWFTFRDQAKQLGMLFRGYVLFHTYYSPAVQAAHVAAAIEDLSIPIMIDLEPDSDTPSLQFAAACWDALKGEGLRPVALYDPRWYWSQLGGPDLRIRPWSLVSSNYGSNAPGAAVSRYQAEGGDTGPGWAAYGGLTPTEWQFGSQIVIGTHADGTTRYGDADAYRGDLASLGASGLFTDWGAMTSPTAADFAAAIMAYPTVQTTDPGGPGAPIQFQQRFANTCARIADLLIPGVSQLHTDLAAVEGKLDTLIGLLTPPTPPGP